MSDSATTKASLLLRVRDHRDRSAWSEFVSLYAPLIYAYGRKQGLQDADAADLAQDVLTQVAKLMPEWSYDASKGSFRGWLFTLARNRLRNWATSHARKFDGSGDSGLQRVLLDVASDRDAEAEWDAEYARQVFHWAAEQVRAVVSKATWLAFEKTAVGGQSGADVARELGMTVAAVYLARGRVMSRLKELVQSLTLECGDLSPLCSAATFRCGDSIQ